MIDYVRGILVKKSVSSIVVEVGGIGCLIEVPFSTLSVLNKGEQVEIFTRLHVRENELRMFGFATEEERELFELLLGVNKVGPATAVSVLSSVPVKEFYSLVRNEDSKALAARVKGMGKKTAERVILELKAVSAIEALPQTPSEEGVTQMLNDTVKGLISLGCTRAAAEKAAQAALKKLGPEADAESLFRQALAIR